MRFSSSRARCRASALLLWVTVSGCGVDLPLGPEAASGTGAATSPAALDDLVGRTNEQRRIGGLAPLAVSERLTQAAQIQARQMAAAERMEHTIHGAEFATLASRARFVGYSFRWIGENIASGHSTTESVMLGWMRSRDHRANILDVNFTEIGVAVAVSAGGTPYYASVFGHAR